MRSHATHGLKMFCIFFLFFFGINCSLRAQSGTEFWLAPPEITDLHNVPGGEPLYLVVSSTGLASTVTVDQPANAAFVPIVVNVAANKSVRLDLTPFKSMLETGPTNTVLNTGLHITSTTTITSYYECANTNNTDIWALKGPNAEGTEFYIPLHKHAPFYNHTFAAPHPAYASFDICAITDGTLVTIYSPTPVDGHAALQQFTISLNRGQTYSCGFTGANYTLPSTHPSGAVVVSNFPITVSLKDDSDQNPSGGCYDILGDQLVPTNVVGEDYIAVKGSLNPTGDESVVLMATQNNTQVFVDGSATPLATLFAGEYFRIDMDSVGTGVSNALFVHCTQPTYAMHITGFGCEMGMAQLPPLNCAGSQQLNFIRDNAQTFYLTVLCRTTAVNGFTVTGPGTATIPAASFVSVPGTGGTWSAAKITCNTTEVPVDSTFKVTNSLDVFALGVVNGGATSGCKYGYFSEFVAPIVANAGNDMTICANTEATLSGSVAGGTITGIWSSTGTGSFTPNNTALNAIYTPSAADAAVGSVTLTLTSTGACIPVSDTMLLTITPPPTSAAGPDLVRCSNNANASLTGAVTIATGGVWTGGNGTYMPGNNVLNPLYIPTAAEITSGGVALTLTTTGNGLCNPVSDNVVISFTPAPVVNAGPDQIKCGNNPAALLMGSVTVATGALWTGGGGSFNPSATSLNPTYTATAAEIAAGSVTLTMQSTGNQNCNAVSDEMTIFFTAPPVVSAGPDQVKCSNNATTTLAGTVTGASGGQWSGGLGLFTPNNNAPNASYQPTAGEIASGFVILTFTSTGNGSCLPVTDQMTITFSTSPTANAGANLVVCANNASVALAGSFTVANGALWSGGGGTYSPSNTSMGATYSPSATEIATGSATLTLTTTGNGSCNAVSDQVSITITPAPTADAGPNQVRCANNAVVSLNGDVTIASGGLWSGGGGSFTPSASALNATYTPSVSEISNGSVQLTLTTTGNGGCNSASDQILITFTPSPVANAGADQTLCANNASASLAGTVQVAGGGQWTGGLGTFLPNNNSLNTSYSPTAAELASGSVNLVLTTTSNGSCVASTDQLVLSFTPAPTSNAGSDLSVCANNASAALNGSITTAGGGQWSGGSGTFLPNATSLTTTYIPSTAEITSGSATLLLTTTGNANCQPVSDQITITISPAPVVDAGPNQSKCANNAVVALNGTVSGAAGGQWSGGSGTFSPSTTALNATYTPSAGELSSGSVLLTLTSTGNGTCNATSDQVLISFTTAPVANAGADQVLCANNASAILAGTVLVAGGGQWSGGLGTFTPNNNSLNSTYSPTAGELASGSVNLVLTTTSNGNCIASSDQLVLSFTPAPTANAGSDLSVCANNASAALNGSITTAGGGQWSGGSGTFLPNATSLNATYTPSSAEITGGSATLLLTTTGNANCQPVTDQVSITITSAPLVDAGPNQVRCANNAVVALNGNISGAAGGQWSGGGGTFSPSTTALNATYTPSASELSSGSVLLTLTSTGNGTCNATSDQVLISFTTAPVANAGADQVLCANNASAILAGTVLVAGGGQWSGGLGTFTPNNNSLNSTYSPTAGELASGSVNLVLTTTSNGSCLPSSDQLTLNFTPAPTANAGTDISVCGNNAAATLNGSFTIAGGAQWTGGGGSFLPNATTLNATYNPSSTEISNGSATLLLTTTGNGTCLPESDEVLISITATPIVNAGEDQVRCANNAAAALSGAVSGASGGTWSGGAGIFNPSSSALNATYTPTATEISNGSVLLTLTSTGNGNCVAVSDQILISFSSAPTANAGSDQVLCANNAEVLLAGNVAVAGGGQWTGGLGIFTPNNNTLNATYQPTASEIAGGSANLVLTTTSNGSCTAVSDQLVLSFTPAPTANAGNDIQVCGNDAEVMLNGSVTIATGATWSGGNGLFTPGNNDLATSYMPSASEISNGSVTLTLLTTGNGTCMAVSDPMTVIISPIPTVNAGPDQVRCANNASASLSGMIAVATGGQWSGGAGIYNPSSTYLNALYTPTADEIASGSVTLVLTSTGNGLCLPESDEITLFFSSPPTASAGSDQVACANNAVVTLNGSVSTASGGQWSGGLGSFSPNSTTLNAQYTPTAGEIASGLVNLVLTTTGNGGCSPVSDNVAVNFTAAPTVNASSDVTVCANNSAVALNGSYTVAGGIQWTGGSGTFVPGNTSPTATYIPSSSEILAGTTTLTLTTTSNGTCLAENDQMNIVIIAAPIVEAGSTISACVNNAVVSLNGQVFNATGGQWSGGSGTYFPNDHVLNATYTPSASEITAGSVLLTLTSTGNGLCNPVSDVVTISFAPAPLVNAGTDQVLCGNNAVAVLSGSSSFSSGVQWTGGLGLFSPSSTVSNANYTPTAGEVADGFVNLVLTTTGNGGCVAVSDQVHIAYTISPTADAGDDVTSCSNASQVVLDGSYTVSGGAIWTGGSGTFTPGNNAMNAAYVPSASEIAAGGLTLTLMTTGNGTCLPATSSMDITIVPSATVNAGNDYLTCNNTLNVGLSGSVSGATNTGIWTTSGTGTFVPNATTLNATYQCSAEDLSAGSVLLTLTSTSNGICNPVSDQATVTIVPPGTANAGSDVTVCGNNAAVTLNGSVSGGASAGTWNTSGTGSFIPNATSLNATYMPSAYDVLTGSVVLNLVANSCNYSSDALTITITPAPIVAAGNDQVMCETAMSTELMGTVSGGSSSGIWITTGSGTFSPSNTSLNATYFPGPADFLNQQVNLVLTSTNNGLCLPSSDTLHLSIYPTGTASAGSDLTVCANNSTVTLSGSVGGGATQGMWSSSGSGYFLPGPSTLNATYVPGAGDLAQGSVVLTLTATNSCNNAGDSCTITYLPAPVVDAGPPQAFCGANPSFILAGSVQFAAGGIWSGGNGTFVPGATSLNATYYPSASELAAGSLLLTLTSTGNGDCNAVSSTVALNMSTGIIASAGTDQDVCISAPHAQLQGSVSNGSSTGLWSTSGSGDFIPGPAALNALYAFSAADLTSGGVTLVLTSTNTGNCPLAADTMHITFGPGAFAFAGNDQSICASDATLPLIGLVSGGATQGQWTASGNGSFEEGSTSLATHYALTPSDISAGQVQFILTTTDNGSCLAGTDTVVYTIHPLSNVLAGGDLTICSNDLLIPINGNISGLTSEGIWSSTGTGNFTPDPSSLSTSYLASASDSLAGEVLLILTATSSGMCPADTDTLTVHLISPPAADAGSDQFICSSSTDVALNGQVAGATSSSQWTSTGNGTFEPDANALNAIYTPGYLDVLNGQVSLVLHAGAQGTCASASDTLTVMITQSTTANAGSDVTICSDNLIVPIAGSVTGDFDSMIWTTSGTGTFVFGNGSSGSNYYPSASDSLVGNVWLILSATGTGLCEPDVDSLYVTITSPSVVFAGSDVSVCASESDVALYGQITGGSTTGFWTSSGNGTFDPDNTTLSAHYLASAADLLNGSVVLTLTSSGNGICAATSDNLQISWEPIPLVSAGPDKVVCGSNNEVQLTGMISGSATTGYWTTTGSGDFVDGPTSLTNTYIMSTADMVAEEVMIILTSTGSTLCAAVSDTTYIHVEPSPVAAFSSLAGENMDVQFINESLGADSWFWDFGDIGSSTVQDPHVVFPEAGPYEVTLIAYSSAGCSDTTTAIAIAVEPTETPVAIPSGFSPNNDESNDVLYVLGGPFREIEFKIYNQWGNLVFETEDPLVGWDGTYKNEPQPGGIYVYTAVGYTVKGRFVRLSGNVTLIR